VSPNGNAATVITAACVMTITTCSSPRPMSNAARLTGVTRHRSMMPARSADSRPYPEASPPNRPIATYSPGM